MHINPETVMVATITAVFASQGFWTWLMHRKANESAESKLLLGLAYSEICKRAEKILERGNIPTTEYQEFYKYLYKPYVDMGGNGTAKKLMHELEELPLTKDS